MAGVEETSFDGTLEELLQKDEDSREKTVSSIETKANEGSEQHKLLLGKYFLRRSETDGNGSKWAEDGVNWLVEAAKQGNEEAATLLSTCLENQQGVTDENLTDVTWCINTDQVERKARFAAKSLFRKIKATSTNPNSPPGILTKEELQHGVEILSKDKKQKKLIEKIGKLDKKNLTITEDYFCERVVKKIQGLGGLTLSSIMQRDVEWESYLNSTALQKLTRYPGKTIAWIFDYTVDSAGSRGMYWLKSLVPTHQIYMLIVFFIYSLISFQFVLWLLPLLAFYISFLCMMVCTMQMFYGKKKLKDVKAITAMLNQFQDTLDSESISSAFTWNSLTPYVTFFVSLVTTILTFTVADKMWIPCSEIVCIAGVFTVTCFFALSDEYEFLAIASITLDNISTLPTIIEGFPRIPVVYHVLQLFAGTLYSYEVVPGLFINFGLPSLAYLLIPLLFLRMATRHSWKGTYKVLVPHLVCFFWWRIAIMFYRHTSWMSLVRASFGWILFVALLPVITIAALFGCVFYLLNFLTVSNFLKVCTTLVLLGIPAVFAYWAQKGFKVKGVSLSQSKTKTAKTILLCLSLISVIPVLFVMMPRAPTIPIDTGYIGWEQYKATCSKPHWDRSNIASAMVSCSHLQGAMVDWTGHVKKIVVKKTENEAEGFINKLPYGIGNWLRCVYGDEYPVCDTIADDADRVICQMNALQYRTCHLKSLNRYTFEIWVKMRIDEHHVHDVRVEASHWFGDTLMNITENDEVHIHAMLVSEIGNIWPVLRLYKIECNSCEGEVRFGGANILVETWHFLVPCINAMQNVWNFFVSPIIEFGEVNVQ